MQQKFILQDTAMAKPKVQPSQEIPEQQEPPTPAQITAKWIELKKMLDQFTQHEKTFRGEVVQSYFKAEHEKLDSKGTFTAQVPELQGELKLVYGQNVKFDQDVFKLVKNKLSEELTPEEYDSLFKIKYELNEPVFKKLTKETRLKIIKYNFLEFNRASPSVKFFPKEPV